MPSNFVFYLVTVIVILVIAIAVIVLIVRARRAVKDLSRSIWGTDSLKEGIDKQNYENATRPKSVSSMTNMLLPQIMKDFPQFDYQDAKVRSETVLTSYLRAIDQHDASLLTEGSEELRENLQMRIAMLEDVNQSEQFDKIGIHRTEIRSYDKRQGRCRIVFQSAVQYKHALLDPTGRVLKGDPDTFTQTRYNVELVYIQDADKSDVEQDRDLALTCPNCGAPLTDTGALKCDYCGSPIIPINLRAWTFHKVEEA